MCDKSALKMDKAGLPFRSHARATCMKRKSKLPCPKTDKTGWLLKLHSHAACQFFLACPSIPAAGVQQGKPTVSSFPSIEQMVQHA